MEQKRVLPFIPATFPSQKMDEFCFDSSSLLTLSSWKHFEHPTKLLSKYFPVDFRWTQM